MGLRKEVASLSVQKVGSGFDTDRHLSVTYVALT